MRRGARFFLDRLFRRSRLDRDMDDEIRSHLDLRAAALEESGLSAQEARRQARLEFGGIENHKEACRDTRRFHLLHDFLADLRYGLRLLQKSPGFTSVAVITLGLGIGANTAIFSIANAVLFRPLPFPHADRLVWMAESFEHGWGSPIAYANFADWRSRVQSFEHMTVHRTAQFAVIDANGAERVSGVAVTPEFFPTLGVRPLLGRDFLAADNVPGAEPVVLISYGFWQRRFGGDYAVVGKTLSTSTRTYTIAGVVPPGRYPTYRVADIYVPLGAHASAAELTKRDFHIGLYGIARLCSGVSLAQADAEMETIARALEQQFPATNTGHRISLRPLQRILTTGARTPLLVLLGTVGFVLLIACANISNLLLARNAARTRELAVRAALGAPRGRIVRQLIVESLLLSTLGGALGVVLGAWTMRLILHLAPDVAESFFRPVVIDYQVLIFTLLISTIVGVLAGLFSAVRASNVGLGDALKQTGNVAGERRHALREAIMAAEMALAFVLLIGAGLMIRTLANLISTDPGFDPHNVLALRLTGRVQGARAREFLDAIRAIPGVHAAASAGGGNNHYFPEGRPLAARDDWEMAGTHSPFGDYLGVMRIPLRKGRWFATNETSFDSDVAVINEAMARHVWPNQDPIGKRFKMGKPDEDSRWVTVIGVLADTRELGMDHSPEPTWYSPYAGVVDLLVRTEGDPAVVVPSIRARIHAFDKTIAIYDVETLDERLAASYRSQQSLAILLGTFAALALLLAAVGLYGVIAHLVAQRTHETGVRLALGATRGDIVGMVLRQGMTPVLIGAALGLAAALALTRFLTSLLVGVTATDALTFSAGGLILVAVAICAIFIPARRAAKLDPMVALRYE